MEPPWRSALVQGKAVEALVKAHELTGNQTYLDAAKSLLNSFFVEAKVGGVRYKTPNDGWWYEEYPNEKDNASQPKILNGMISSVLDNHEYYRYTNDASMKFLFDQGLLALTNTLSLYDNNGWSYYDIHKKPANPGYPLIRIRLLDALSNIRDKIFEGFTIDGRRLTSLIRTSSLLE
jgi:heparosan-N-sulfate-glucuronate 5-epimerase